MEASQTLVANLSVDVLTESDLVAGFNLWMDEYMNDPGAFYTSCEAAQQHLSERLNGEEHTYGEVSYSTLIEYVKKAKLHKGENE